MKISYIKVSVLCWSLWTKWRSDACEIDGVYWETVQRFIEQVQVTVREAGEGWDQCWMVWWLRHNISGRNWRWRLVLELIGGSWRTVIGLLFAAVCQNGQVEEGAVGCWQSMKDVGDGYCRLEAEIGSVAAGGAVHLAKRGCRWAFGLHLSTRIWHYRLVLRVAGSYF